MRLSSPVGSFLLVLTASLVGCVGDSPTTTPPNDAATNDTGSPQDAGSDAVALDAPVDAPPTPVNGTVVDGQGIPVANANVRIAGLDAKTDGSGKFTLNAPPTYDVMVASSTTGTTETLTTTTGKKLTAFFGLSTRTPTLQVAAATQQSTTLALTTTGLAAVGSSDVVNFVTAPTTASSSSFFDQTASQTVKWGGAAPSTGVLWAYHTTLTGGIPTAWKGVAGPVNYNFPAGNAALTVPFSGTVATSAFNVTIDASGHSVFRAFLGHERQAGARIVFLLFGFTGSSITATMPNLGASSVTVWATSPTGANVQLWRVGVKLPATTALKLPTGDLTTTAPAADATGVGVGTTFSWSAPPQRAFHVRINCGTAPASYLADFLTTTPSFVLPDSSALGVPVPAQKSCTWVVDAFEPATNADGLVGPVGWVGRLDSTRGATDGSTFGTQAKKFTTP
jgi:hypothetical protein